MDNLTPIDDLFFTIDEQSEKAKRTVCTSLLFALEESETFDLTNIWTLFRSTKPSGIFNGGAQVVSALNEVKQLSVLKLISEDEGEPYSNEFHFSLSKNDSPSNTFMKQESKKFSSKTVRLTPYGREMAEILHKFEADLKDGKTLKRAAQNAIRSKIKIFYDYRRKSILIDEVERLVRLHKKMTVREIRLACEEFGFHARSRDIFSVAELLCYSGCFKREKVLQCALTKEGEAESKNESYSRTSNRINKLLEKYFDKEKNLLVIPAEIGEFVFDQDDMKRLDTSDLNTLSDLIERGYFSLPRTPYECDVPFAPIYYKDCFEGKTLSDLAQYSYMELSLLQYKQTHEDSPFTYSRMLLKFMNAGLYSPNIDFEHLFNRVRDL